MKKLDYNQSLLMGLVVTRRTIPLGATREAVLPQWVLGMTFGGECEQGQPNGMRFIVRKGDFVIIRGKTPQRWRIVGKKEWRSIDCIFNPRPHWISWLNWREAAPGFMKLSLGDSTVYRKVRNSLTLAYRLGKSGMPGAMDFVYNEIEKVLLLTNRYYRQSGISQSDPRVDKAIQYLTGNLAVHMGLNEVAAFCGLSRTQLAYLFKHQVGIGPIAFQNEQRITQSKQMLGMSFLSVKQIAFELGFKNPKYFSTCFRRITGVNPRQYRRKLISVRGT
jgi:AraC family transcriptional regulator, arabinose operon regulatory protein